MSAFRQNIVKQFKKPTGALGRLAGEVMAARPSNKRRNQWTLELLALKPDDRVFELGCGPGYALSLAAARTPKGAVTGVDHSAVMAAMARRRLKKALAAGRANIIIGDDRFLRAFEEELNVVYSANVVQFLDTPSRYFEWAYKALAPGGRMATTYQPRGKNPTAEQAEAQARLCSDCMEKAGFVDIRHERLALGDAPAICVLGRKSIG